MITIGKMSKVSVNAPAARLRVPPNRNCTKTANPSNPYTTEGTPAKLDMLSWISRVTLLSGANSSK